MILVSLLFSLLSPIALAAPCCGSAANVPGLITGDDRLQLTATASTAGVVADAPVGGGINSRADRDSEIRQMLRLEGATLLSDRWQMGASLPIIRRVRDRGSSHAEATGLGDLVLTAAFEALPEWSYSAWRPKAFVFLGATLPTGSSIYDSALPYRIDSRGRGFYSLSLGGLATKAWGSWDVQFLAEGHYSLPRNMETELGVLHLVPGVGYSSSLGVGYSPGGGSLRAGVSGTVSVESAVQTTGLTAGSGEAITLVTPTLQLNYLFSSELSLGLFYSDQALVAASDNSSLSRSVSFMLQKRWPR